MALNQNENLVSQPPLSIPVLDNNGLLSRAWAIFFRDVYKRIAYKGGNAIDDLDGELGGTIDTLEEVIVVVIDHEERIDILEDDNDQNKEDIATNKQNALDLEYRVFGNNRPEAYDEAIGYSANDYIINPSSNPQSYYRAISDITLPAGTFDPLLWKKVSLIDNDAYIELTREQAKSSFVAAGYGGIGVNAVKAIGTINATFKTLEGFDIDLIATPLDVTYDKANHGLKLDRQGIWEATIKIALTFDGLNAGRQLQLRAYNATKLVAGANTFNYFIGRNQDGTNLPLTISLELPEADVGDLIQLQIGSATDTFTNSNNIGTIYQFKHISERKEDLGA